MSFPRRATSTTACKRRRNTSPAPRHLTEWECYIGHAAIDQQIIGDQLLGQYAPAPGVG